MPHRSNTKKDHSLGRLPKLGIDALWQVPLFLPKSHQDLRQSLRKFDELPLGTHCYIEGCVVTPPRTITGHGPLRTTFDICALTLRKGGRAIVLLPNQLLAEQVARNLGTWWPDLEPVLITSNTTGFPQGRLLVGTFEIARQDMHLRGFGDLSSNSDQQTGRESSLLPGRGVSIETLEMLVEAGLVEVLRKIRTPSRHSSSPG